MTYERYFRRTRRLILSDLDAFLRSRRSVMARVRPWGPDVLRRLSAFTRKGKLIRGGLVILGFEMAGRRLTRSAVRAGTALELMQSALLIHDDIMDRDALRRGAPSLHRQYALWAEKRGLSEADHFGVSMGICAGEVAIFLAFEGLAGLEAPAARAAEVQRLFSSEFGLVGLGQMRDIQAGSSEEALTAEGILDLYRYKTARYSFSLPLSVGWVLAGGPKRVRVSLEALGECLGLIFQLKDDELGLFGDERTLGKPVGSDIRQRKKTLLLLRLQERADEAGRALLGEVLGRPDVSEEDLERVREMARRSGAVSSLARTMSRLEKEARRIIAGLPVAARHREVLETLLDFSLARRV